MFKTIESLAVGKKIRNLSNEVGTQFVSAPSEKVDANVLGFFEESVHKYNYVSQFLENEDDRDYLEEFDSFTRNAFFNLTAEEINCHAYMLKRATGMTKAGFNDLYKNAVAKSNRIIEDIKQEGKIAERAVFSDYVATACKSYIERESRYLS